MSPQTSDVKPKLSAELITDMSQALTHVNTSLLPFKSARNETNFSMWEARLASPNLTVDVNNINHRRTHAQPAQTLYKFVNADNNSTTLAHEFVRTSSSVMQTNTSN